jgi:enoyl-CoA hydratase/carnithine racemase
VSGLVGIALERRAAGLIARVSIERAAKLNSLDTPALEALAQAVSGLPAEVRAVVVTGAGERAFAGGADIDELATLDSASAREFITRVHRACAALRECPVPVIARVNGYALGAGLELAAACDLRIAAAHAVFGMPEVRLGIPSVVEAALLPRLIGAGRARWLVMTGGTIDAAQALAWGLVERVVPGAELDAAVDQALAWGLVERVVPGPELDAAVDQALDALLAAGDAALRAQKRLCKLWEEAPLDDCVRLSIVEFAAAYAGDEPTRMIADFLAARKKR